MADDYNNRQSSSLNIFSKVEVEPELLESCDESDDSRIEMKFVEENVMVKREENNLFVSNSDEDGGDEDCYKNEGIFPDFMEPSEINSTVTVSMDPFKCDAAGVYVGDAISSSEVIKTEQVNALDNFYDESEYQEEEQDNNYNDFNDPVDTMVDLYTNLDESPPIKKSKSTPKFPCPKCDRIFARKFYFDNHIISHQDDDKDEEDRPFTCPLCKQQFHFEKNLTLHYKLVHKQKLLKSPPKRCHKKRNFVCTICYKKFQLDIQLQTHIRQMHWSVECAICHRHVKHERSLARHIKCRHPNMESAFKNNEGPFAKNIVKSFNASSNANFHTCEICFKGFKLAIKLRQHQSRIHSIAHVRFPSYKCETCNKQFWKSTALVNHRRVTHKPQKNKKNINLKKKRELMSKKEESQELICLEEEDDTSTVSGKTNQEIRNLLKLKLLKRQSN